MKGNINDLWMRWLTGGATLLLLAGGLFFWLYLRARPFSRRGKRKRGDLFASLRALSVALAGTLGIGNIVGVSFAIAAGGAGALFWMWVSAFVAMILKYAEIVLACRYRTEDGRGGAMYYMRDGIGGRIGHTAGTLFALLCLLLALVMGGLMQSETVIELSSDVLGGSSYIYGGVMTILTALVVFGGVSAVSAATVRLVPLMSALYIGMCLGVIVVFHEMLPSTFARIWQEAFEKTAAGGGIGGFLLSKAMRQGVSRGLLSNEAGCGTAPMAHVTADGTDPVRQGRMGMLEVFVDTILICTLSGISILLVFPDSGGEGGIGTVLAAFGAVYGRAAGYLLALSVFFFAYATVICWGYYGENCVSYLAGDGIPVFFFRVLYCIAVFCGCLFSAEAVFGATDLLLAGMTILNLLALLALAREVRGRKEIKKDRSGVSSRSGIKQESKHADV